MSVVRLLLLALALIVAGCGDEAPRLAAGQPVPAFTLERPDGSVVHFPDDLRGQVVAVRFWADWCPFCKGEMTALEPLYRRLHDSGFRILALNVRQDADTARAFAEAIGISYDVLLDRDGAVARAYGVTGLPTTFVVDRSGRLVTRIVGESTPELMERLVTGLLAPGEGR